MVRRTDTRRLGAVLGLALLIASAAACGGGGTGGGNGDEGSGGAKATAGPTSGGFGGTLSGGANFAVLLVVFEQNSGTVDRVFVSCGSSGTIAQTVGVATHVAIDDEGSFSGQSNDVAVSGTFTSPTTASGTIRALSDGARSCGVPAEATWQASCAYRVKTTPRLKSDPGGLVVGLSVATGDGGRKIAHLSDNATTREQGFSLDPGACVTSTG